jgi:Tfp pilus assembly protein PilV
VNVLAAIHEHNIRQCFSGHPDQVYVEQMSLNTGRDYSRGKAIRTANDLLVITNIAASVVSLLGGELVHVPVGTWKGSCPKTVTKNRVLATLDKTERQVLEASFRGVRSSLHNNLYDAAGIGLYAARRYFLRGNHG